MLQLGRSVDALEQFVEVVLYGGHSSDDGWSAEAVSDQREVAETALNGGVERCGGGRRQRVGGGHQRTSAEWRLVAHQQVGEFFHCLSVEQETSGLDRINRRQYSF